MASIVRRKTRNGDNRYDVRYRDVSGKVNTETYRTRAARQSGVPTRSRPTNCGERGLIREPPRRRSDRSPPTGSSRTWRSDRAQTHVTRASSESTSSQSSATKQSGRSHRPESVGSWTRGLPAWSLGRFRGMYGVLRAIFGYTVDSGALVATPCRGIKLPVPSSPSNATSSRPTSWRRSQTPSGTTTWRCRTSGRCSALGGVSVVTGIRVGRPGPPRPHAHRCGASDTRTPRAPQMFGPPKSTAVSRLPSPFP